MRGCGGKKGTVGLVLIAAGILLLAVSVPLRIWVALLGCVLIVAGLLMLRLG